MPSAASPPQTQSIRPVFSALMLVLLLASLDQTIMSSALPTIVGEFGGLGHLSWIVTAYMLASTVVTPVYGKLGDLIGRKTVLQSAIGIFLLGSVLCGLSQSMTQLILFRAVQGLGGGGLMITTSAVIGDLVPPRERGRFQGIFGAIYGLSTVLGPLLGGFFVEHLSWRWIFYINLPTGLLAVAVIGWAFAPPARRERPVIDIAGALSLALLLTTIVLATSLGGHSLAWDSPEIIAMAVVGLLAATAFIRAERRAVEPLLPLELFANRTFAVACAVGFIVGMAMFGSVTYMPLYLQVAKGVSPSLAGFQLMPMMGGILISGITSGQIISRTGRYRHFPIIGTAVSAAALALLSTLGLDSSPWSASGYMLLLGLGLGMVMQVLILAVQNSVDYRHLGTATSGTTLFRLIGGSIGVSLFGAIFAASLSDQLSHLLPPGTILPAAADPHAIRALPAAIRTAYLHAFANALQPVFISSAILAAGAFALSWLLREMPLHEGQRRENLGDLFGMPHDANSLEELEAIIGRQIDVERSHGFLRRLGLQKGIDLTPGELWLLVRLHRRETPSTLDALSSEFGADTTRLQTLNRSLTAKGLLGKDQEPALMPTAEGRTRYEKIVDVYRHHLTSYLDRWEPEQRDEVAAMVNRYARDAINGTPMPES